MPSAAIDAVAADAVAAAPAATGRAEALALLAGTAPRLMLAGHPRAMLPNAPRIDGLAYRPKEVLLALAGALAEAEGREVLSAANPHFTPVAEWDSGLAVAHFCPLELTCPLPLARNTLLLDGEDVLMLAEEQRGEEQAGLQRRRVRLMDQVLSLAPPALGAAAMLPDGVGTPAPVAALLDLAGTLAAPLPTGPARGTRQGRAPQAGPVQWMRCDLETGHYNFLELKRQPRLGSSHAGVLLDPALRGGASALIGFATPATLADLGPALRAFAALHGRDEVEGAPQFFVFFFGTPEEFTASLASRPDAMFFGDNFRCPAIRFLFAPFAAAEVLAAIRGATAVIDCCYGGVLDALAGGLGLDRRVMLGPGGAIDAVAEGRALARGIAWESVLRPATLAERRHKMNRAGERRLAEVLETLLEQPANG